VAEVLPAAHGSTCGVRLLADRSSVVAIAERVRR